MDHLGADAACTLCHNCEKPVIRPHEPPTVCIEQNRSPGRTYARIYDRDYYSLRRHLGRQGSKQVTGRQGREGRGVVHQIHNRNPRRFARQSQVELANVGALPAEVSKKEDHGSVPFSQLTVIRI